jgi:lysylphosphatidylglycerol synthetase-like protein (DUF2156 family)
MTHDEYVTKLEKILKRLCDDDAIAYSSLDYEQGVKVHKVAITAILQLNNEAIGKDKKPFNTNFNRGIKPDIVTEIENQLRQELREKIKAYCGDDK